MKRMLLLLLGGLAAAPSLAQEFTPENGLWINQNEPGYTFSIEIQDRFLYVVAYTYADDAGRAPTWVAAQGLMQDERTFEAPMYTRTGGTCPGCPFIPPNPSFATGPTLGIEFLSETSANLTWAGRTIPIHRFDYYLTRGLNATPPGYDLLLGQWQLVVDQTAVDNAQPYFADVITLHRKGALGGHGLGYHALGCRPGDATGLCEAATSLANARAVVLRDGSGLVEITVTPIGDFSEHMLYLVRFSLNQFSGIAKRCVADDIPFGRRCIETDTIPSMPVRGWRSASRSFVVPPLPPGDND